LTRVLGHHVHPGEAVPHARQWWQEHLCEEDASEVLYPGSFDSINSFARTVFLVLLRCCWDFLAPVSLLLEIVLLKPDPVGTAARHVIGTRVACGVFGEIIWVVEVFDYLCLCNGVVGLLVPSQSERGFGTSI